jgi:hypothetical protein
MLMRSETEKELVYLPEIDRIPNFLVVDHPEDAPAALAYASLVAYQSSSDQPLAARPAEHWHYILGHANLEAVKQTSKVVHRMELTTSSMPDCDPCGKAKLKQHYSWVQQTPLLTALGRVYIDLIGPLTI